MNFRKIIDRLKFPGMTLKRRVYHGGFWVFAMRIFRRLIGFIRTIILARILVPEDFGLFGIALISISIFERFSQTGVKAKLIQVKDNVDDYLDTAWTIQLIRGFVLAAFLYFASSYISIFFEDPRASDIIRVLSISFFLNGFTNIGIVFFDKNIEFHKSFIYYSVGALTNFIVAMIIALIFRSVWALVLGFVAGDLLQVMLSYYIHDFRPKFELNIEKFKELFSFGKWMFGSSIINFFNTEGDDIFVGKVLSTSSLGFYQMAYKISNMPTTEITHIISKVTFPAYSQVQDKLSKLRNMYIKILRAILSLSFPLTSIIILFSYDFTRIALGVKWLNMVPALQVLAVWGLIRSIGATTGPVFKALDRPDLITKLQSIKFLIMIILIYPLTVNYGIQGAAYVVVISALIVNPIADYFVIKITESDIRVFVKSIAIPLVSSVLMSAGIFFIKAKYFGTIGILEFLCLILLSIFVYLILLWMMDIIFNFGIKDLLVNLYKRLKEKRND